MTEDKLNADVGSGKPVAEMREIRYTKEINKKRRRLWIKQHFKLQMWTREPNCGDISWIWYLKWREILQHEELRLCLNTYRGAFLDSIFEATQR